MRKDYLGNVSLDSVYFGGGTPSLLSPEELETLLNKIGEHFPLKPDAEITLEANPDDLSPGKLEGYRGIGLNRMSIGIQSFAEADLKFMNRVHTADEAHQSIDLCQEAGFDNLSIDLIYGTPTMDGEQWNANLTETLSYGLPHISAYCLTVEPKTALAVMVEKGKVADVDDAVASVQFERVMDVMDEAGYEHYEISNFCLPGYQAKHNSSYWTGETYLGIGPSAHSFDGKSRCWNLSNNTQYIKAIQSEELPSEAENLTQKERFNEYVMTSLRTSRGCDPAFVQQNFGDDFSASLTSGAKKHIERDLIDPGGSALTLTRKGKLLADHVIADLFLT